MRRLFVGPSRWWWSLTPPALTIAITITAGHSAHHHGGEYKIILRSKRIFLSVPKYEAIFLGREDVAVSKVSSIWISRQRNKRKFICKCFWEGTESWWVSNDCEPFEDKAFARPSMYLSYPHAYVGGCRTQITSILWNNKTEIHFFKTEWIFAFIFIGRHIKVEVS